MTGPYAQFSRNRETFLHQLENALYVGFIVSFAQGLALLRAGSQVHEYGLEAEVIARIWRGGCIIRAALLEKIRTAFAANPDLANLMVDPNLALELIRRQDDLRSVVHVAVDLGIAVPALMSALAYYDAYRSAWLPANLVQALRDYFGAHTYERVDAKGVFHTEWEKG